MLELHTSAYREGTSNYADIAVDNTIDSLGYRRDDIHHSSHHSHHHSNHFIPRGRKAFRSQHNSENTLLCPFFHPVTMLIALSSRFHAVTVQGVSLPQCDSSI